MNWENTKLKLLCHGASFFMKNNNTLKKQMENKMLLIWKLAIASGLSWEIAKLSGSDHPYLAPISVILCLQSTINRSVLFSYHRMVGTVIGISTVVLVEPYLKVNGWTLGLIILISCFIAKWLKWDETVIHQVALTVLLVFVMEHKSGQYPMDRFRDTLIGALVAVLLHMLLFPPNFTKQVSKNFEKFSEHLSNTYYRTANWVKTDANKNEGYHLQTEVKQVLEELHQMENLIKDANDSLKFNFFASKSRKFLQEYQQRLYYLTLGHTYLTTFIGTIQSWAEATTITPTHQLLWADQLSALTPFFKGKIHPEELCPLGETLKVSLSTDLEKQKFHVSLFHATTSMLSKMEELPKK
jgi:uncharacterized membrane protein YgaE (UPF0421/DUF939 family)